MRCGARAATENSATARRKSCGSRTGATGSAYSRSSIGRTASTTSTGAHALISNVTRCDQHLYAAVYTSKQATPAFLKLYIYIALLEPVHS